MATSFMDNNIDFVPICDPSTESLHYIDVRVERDGNYWFAEGIDYDYASQGDTYREAIDNFQAGLQATVLHRIERHGSMDWNSMKWKQEAVVVRVPGPIVQRIERFGPNE